MEVAAYARALLRYWKALLTSSLPIALLWVAQGQGWYAPPPWSYGIAGALALVFASFFAWRDEFRLNVAGRAERIHDVPDEIFWLIALVEMHPVRRKYLPDHGASLNAIWIDEIPISPRGSTWLYDLVTAAREYVREHGTGSGSIYRLYPESEKILRVERQRGRLIKAPPGRFFDARTDEPATISLP